MSQDKPVRPISPAEEKFARPIIKLYTRLNVWVYRLTRGRLMGRFPNGGPVCLVTMTGARSGKQRTIGLIHIPDGDNIVLVASQGGMSHHPAWYYNLRAHPDITINYRGNTRRYRAEQVGDAEKARLWPRICEVHPGFEEYQERTDRNIPVFVCRPISD